MTCPFCGNEMECGNLIIDGRTHPLWQFDGKKYGRLDRFLGIDGKELRGISEYVFYRTKINAHHCPACKKFIFDGWVDKY